MDTLMDKLSEKLNAQEMIRANGQAETERMTLLRAEVGEYKKCLDRMKQVCSELTSLEGKLTELALPDKQSGVDEETVNAIRDEISELSERTNKQLSELSKSTDRQLGSLSENSEKQFKSMEDSLLEKVSTDEAVHKECVRVYKNVQAAIKDENANQVVMISGEIEKNTKDLKTVKILAIVGVVCSALAALMAAAELFNLPALLGL